MTSRILKQIVAIVVASFVAFGAYAQDDIQDLADQWTAAYNAHDKDTLGALYSEDAALMLHGTATIKGRDAIKSFWESDFEIGSPLTSLKVTHSVTGTDMMLVHGNYQVIDRETGEQMGGGRFAHIWMLEDDGKWRLDRDLWNQPHEPVE